MDFKKGVSIRISSSFLCLKLIDINIIIIFILTAIDSYGCNILLRNHCNTYHYRRIDYLL